MGRAESGGGGWVTCWAVIRELRSKTLEIYPGDEEGGKGTSGSDHDIIDKGDEIGQRESSWRGWCGWRGEQAVVVGLDKSDNE